MTHSLVSKGFPFNREGKYVNKFTYLLTARGCWRQLKYSSGNLSLHGKLEFVKQKRGGKALEAQSREQIHGKE